MFYEAEVLCQRSSLGKVWIAAHWDKKLSKNAISQYSETDIVKEASEISSREGMFSLRLRGHLLYGLCRIYYKKVEFLYADCTKVLVKIKNTFHPASSIDLDERTVALGTIALGGGGLEEFELEFPASEPDMNLLPEHDDNLLSLHDARHKVLLTGGRSSRGMDSSSSSALPFDMHSEDLLRSEIDSSVEVERGGHGDIEVPRAGAFDAYSQLDYGGNGPEYSFPNNNEYDGGMEDIYRGPEGNGFEAPAFDDPVNVSFGGFSDAPSLPLNSSIQQPDHVFAMPTSGARAKRTWAEMVDRNTSLDDGLLRRQIKDKFFHDGPNRVAAPQTREEEKRENILESINLPIMRITPVPLRPLFTKALEQRNVSRGPNAMEDDLLQFDNSQDLNGSVDNGVDMADIFRGENQRSVPATPAHDDYRWNHDDGGAGDEYPLNLSLPSFTAPEEKSDEIDRSVQSELEQSTTETLSAVAHQIATNVRRELQRHNPNSNGPYNFQEVFTHPKFNRRQIAQSFLGLLELKAKEHIELSQDEPYGNIEFTYGDAPVPSLPASQIEASS